MDLKKLSEVLDQRDSALYLDRLIRQSLPGSKLDDILFRLRQHNNILARLPVNDSRRAEIEREAAALSEQRDRLIAEYPQLGQTATHDVNATGVSASPSFEAGQSHAVQSMQPTPPARESSEPKKGQNKKKLVKRNMKYEAIDGALRTFAPALPTDHEEVFLLLQSRKVLVPNRKPFKAAGGWFKGFQKDPHAARAWLSQRWGQLGLQPFARGPKK